MMRRMHSNRCCSETMVDFWSNHLHVKVNADSPGCSAPNDAVIRKNALGRFDDLKMAATPQRRCTRQLALGEGRANENRPRVLERTPWADLGLPGNGQDSAKIPSEHRRRLRVVSGYDSQAHLARCRCRVLRRERLRRRQRAGL
jgi:hypothetical protein